jgi:hypothetical protein
MMRRTLISYREGETNDPVGLNPQKASSYYHAVKPFTNPPRRLQPRLQIDLLSDHDNMMRSPSVSNGKGETNVPLGLKVQMSSPSSCTPKL